MEKIPVPKPGPLEVLVEVQAVGICASDAKNYLGAERFWGKKGNAQIQFFFLENCIPQKI